MDIDDDDPQSGRSRRSSGSTARATSASASASGSNPTPASSQAPTHAQLSKRRRGLGVVTTNACTECRKKRAKVPFAPTLLSLLDHSKLTAPRHVFSATDSDHAPAAGVRRILSVSTRCPYASPRKTYATRLRLCANTSVPANRSLLLWYAQGYGRTCWYACAAANQLTAYRNGLGEGRPRKATSCPRCLSIPTAAQPQGPTWPLY